MVVGSGPRVFAIADDLAGAAETAAALALGNATVFLDLPDVDVAEHTASVAVLDTDCRHLADSEAVAALEAAMTTARARTADHFFVKIDSLLRGPIAATVAALNARGYAMLVAPAVPAFGRSVRGGRVLVDGVPLDVSGSWAVERANPPQSLGAALSPLPVTSIGRDMFALSDVGRQLAAVLDDGRVPVCDAEDDADLDRITAAALRIPHLVFVGAGGLAAAVGRALYYSREGAPTPAQIEPPDAVLIVVGTASHVARSQIAVLEAAGAHHIRIAETESRNPLPPAGARVVVLSFDQQPPSVPVASSSAAEMLARRAAELVERRGRTDLVLTGGDTARRVLDALGIRRLRPFNAVHPGAIASWADADNRVVVTRPGSIGGPGSFDRIVRFLMPPGKKGRWG